MKQKLVIIGGGISGLYLADKYKDKYNIILLERSNRIGGKIQSYGNFSISTQSPSYHVKCKPFDNYLKELNLKPYLIQFKIYNHYPKLLYLFLSIFIIFILFYNNNIKYKLLLLLYCIIIPYFSGYKVIRALGSSCSMNYLAYIKSYSLLKGELMSLLIKYYYIGFMKGEFDFIVKHIEQKLNNIIYTNANIIKLDKINKIIVYTYNNMKNSLSYDKLIIASNIFNCNFIDVSNIINIYPTFKFYTAIVKILPSYKLPSYLNGYSIVNKDYIILSSHQPIHQKDFTNCIVIKTFIWDMPTKVLNNYDKIKLKNYLKKYDIYSCGEHICEGVKELINNADKIKL